MFISLFILILFGCNKGEEFSRNKAEESSGNSGDNSNNIVVTGNGFILLRDFSRVTKLLSCKVTNIGTIEHCKTLKNRVKDSVTLAYNKNYIYLGTNSNPNGSLTSCKVTDHGDIEGCKLNSSVTKLSEKIFFYNKTAFIPMYESLFCKVANDGTLGACNHDFYNEKYLRDINIYKGHVYLYVGFGNNIRLLSCKFDENAMLATNCFIMNNILLLNGISSITSNNGYFYYLSTHGNSGSIVLCKIKGDGNFEPCEEAISGLKFPDENIVFHNNIVFILFPREGIIKSCKIEKNGKIAPCINAISDLGKSIGGVFVIHQP